MREWECGVGVGMRGDSQMEPMAVMEMSPTSQMFPTRTLTLHAKNSWTTVATMPTMAGSSYDASSACQRSSMSLSQHVEQYLLRTLRAHIVRRQTTQSSACHLCTHPSCLMRVLIRQLETSAAQLICRIHPSCTTDATH